MDKIHVFISYRHEDSQHQVGRLYDRLTSQFGADAVFRDVDSIAPGLDFREAINEWAVKCDVFLAVIGDLWLSIAGSSGQRRLDDPDDFVRVEIEAALRRGIPVIPVLVSKAPVPPAADLPESLRELSFRHAVPIRHDPDFHHDVDRLIVGIGLAIAEARRRTDGKDDDFDAPTPIPERFGRYRIIQQLGVKTRGSVYLADDRNLQQRVALKVPDFGPRNPVEARLRFLAEARTLSTLKHPQLCPVLESGEIDGRPYLAMAYIDGKSLDRTIHLKGLPSRQVAVLVGELALAMQEVHSKGVIHRNLKPANIIFHGHRRTNDAVIVDFGQVQTAIAKSDRSGNFATSGKPFGYLAPEQVAGNTDYVGPACDIFALGVILYELLVGELPLRHPNGAVITIGPSAAPVSSAALQSRLDPALGVICHRAMATEAAGRYATMRELHAALAAYLRSPSAAWPRMCR